MRLGCPAPAVVFADRQRAELVEREATLQELGGHLLDPVGFGVDVRVLRFFPGAGPLLADVVTAQDLPQPFPADDDLPVGVGGEVVGELAQAPAGEGPPLAVATMTVSSSSRIRRGQPPDH